MANYLLRDTTTSALTLVSGTTPFTPAVAAGTYDVFAVSDAPASTELVIAAAPPPEQFSYLDWDMDPSGDIIVSALPASASAITALQIQIDTGSGFGSAVTLPGTTTGTYASSAAPGDRVQIRAVSANGDGAWSVTQLCPVFVDRFNRSNEQLQVSADWEQGVSGSFVVASNRVEKSTSTGTDQAWVVEGSALLADCRIEFDVAAMITDGSGTAINIIGRHPVGGNANGDAVVMQLLGTGNAVFQTRTGTTSTTIETINWTPPGVPFRGAMELQGTAMRFLVNGVLVGEVTQSAFGSAGRPGFRCFRSADAAPSQSALALDNFRVSPL